MSDFNIRAVSSIEVMMLTPTLSRILMDCVEGGASVSFMKPLALAKAEVFWRKVAEDVASGDRVMLIAEDKAREILGTVQIVVGQPENQPHRADISKLLVHNNGRRRGLGAALMNMAEEAAAEAGKTLLVLDTAAGGDAERLYRRLGWTCIGQVPDYALTADGRTCATSIFYKRLAA